MEAQMFTPNMKGSPKLQPGELIQLGSGYNTLIKYKRVQLSEGEQEGMDIWTPLYLKTV